MKNLASKPVKLTKKEVELYIDYKTSVTIAGLEAWSPERWAANYREVGRLRKQSPILQRLSEVGEVRQLPADAD